MEERMMGYKTKSGLAFASMFVVAALAASPTSSQTAKQSTGEKVSEYPTSYCTNRGHRVELGKTSCLQDSNDRKYLARCVMVLNNPSWKKIGESCALDNSRSFLAPKHDLTVGQERAIESRAGYADTITWPCPGEAKPT
jgi:hypothetical protein